MTKNKYTCAFCGKEVTVTDRIGRGEDCPHCGRALHCCLQCRFYDPAAHHECREPQAEYVSDKEKSNFCDYFDFGPQLKTDTQKKAEEAKNVLASLFRKKEQ